MIEKILARFEKKILDTMGDRMSIETVFCAEEMTLTTVSFWDGDKVSEYVFDLMPLVDAIEARIKAR